MASPRTVSQLAFLSFINGYLCINIVICVMVYAQKPKAVGRESNFTAAFLRFPIIINFPAGPLNASYLFSATS